MSQPLEITFPEYIDKEAIRSLQQTADMGDPELIPDLIDLFQQGFTRKITDMKKALDEKDDRKLMFSSHSLKSSCRTLGSPTMAEACARIEATSRAAKFEGIDSDLKILENEFPRVMEFLMMLKTAIKNLAA